ncbi:MAG: methyltransferase domain-containing protein [Acidobacteria bacterium]|nr:methyltransferase domain-containing protein [Acidobacteriota bacterium]
MNVEAPRPVFYSGRELEVFAGALRWKAYWSSRIRQWVCGDVLEPGAGLGANTALLQNPDVTSWRCLEADAALAAAAREALAHLKGCTVSVGTIAGVAAEKFDTVLYIDVLEHIAEDRAELAAAAQVLREGGHIVVVAPAHQFLFSAFDAAIGHYRRYNRESLLACSPPECRLEAMFYLDSAGMAASLANRLLLRQSRPTAAQIGFWDRGIVPVSRVLDRLAGYRVGKTICGVWTRLPR